MPPLRTTPAFITQGKQLPDSELTRLQDILEDLVRYLDGGGELIDYPNVGEISASEGLYVLAWDGGQVQFQVAATPDRTVTLRAVTSFESPEIESEMARRTVTVLAGDVTRSTELAERLDPESFRRVLQGLFDQLRRVVSSHGGKAERSVGDAFLGVFGAVKIREDDAERAVRAAVELRAALAEFDAYLEGEMGVRLDVRMALNTGEVVVEGPEPEIVGEAPTLAVRLTGVADRGETLLSEATYGLVRDIVVAEPLPEFQIVGTSSAVRAWRLLSVLPQGHQGRQRTTSPLIGRKQELQLLRLLYERVVHERGTHVVTVAGEPGVGKTRLADEFLTQLGGQALILRTRCSPSETRGDYWPMADIVQQAAGISPGDSWDVAWEKLLARLEGNENATAILARLLRLGVASAQPSPDEIEPALRALFWLLASKRPLVLVIDDLHWAGQELLDLLISLGRGPRGASILILCLARSEIFEGRDWGANLRNATSLSLSPLSTAEGELLVTRLLGDSELTPATVQQVVDMAQGSPLFVEALVERLQEGREVGGVGEAASELGVPARIDALLAARLDRLPRVERRVLERAAVVGPSFTLTEVDTLLRSGRTQVKRALDHLVDRGLLDLDSGVGDETYRFRHVLVRKIAYRFLPKATRAILHDRFAAWLAATGGSPSAVTDHREKAASYRREVGAAAES